MANDNNATALLRELAPSVGDEHLRDALLSVADLAAFEHAELERLRALCRRRRAVQLVHTYVRVIRAKLACAWSQTGPVGDIVRRHRDRLERVQAKLQRRLTAGNHLALVQP